MEKWKNIDRWSGVHQHEDWGRNWPKVTCLPFPYRSQRLTNKAFYPQTPDYTFFCLPPTPQFLSRKNLCILPYYISSPSSDRKPSSLTPWTLREGPDTIQGCIPHAWHEPVQKYILLSDVIDYSHVLGLGGLIDFKLPLYPSNNLKRLLKEMPSALRAMTFERWEPGLVTALVFSSIKLVG